MLVDDPAFELLGPFCWENLSVNYVKSNFLWYEWEISADRNIYFEKYATSILCSAKTYAVVKIQIKS